MPLCFTGKKANFENPQPEKCADCKVSLLNSEGSPDKYREKIAAFAVKTKCDSDYSLECHILANWDKHPTAMRVYANSTPVELQQRDQGG